MSNDLNTVHHVTWCVHPDNLDRVREIWAALGIELVEVDLPDEGVSKLVSWEGGVEIMSPTYETGTLADLARDFLDEHGEGVFAVVISVPDLDDAVDGLARTGVDVVRHEHITADEFEEREIAGVDTDTPTRQLVRQAVFGEIAGIRLCAQEVRAER